MSNKKNKERWQRIQENSKKTCLNCSQLCKYRSGDYICYHLKTPDETPNGGCLHSPEYVKQVHALCYDKYNGKNIKNK
jgi:hypothetical protein